MSSETSIKEPAPSLPSWQLFALAGLVGATIVVFVSRGQSPAAIILLSLVVFAAAAVGAAARRWSRRQVAAPAPAPIDRELDARLEDELRNLD